MKARVGDRVKDRVSGFAGVVVAATSYMNGCTRCGVHPSVKKDGTLPEEKWFDEPQLRVTKRNAVPKGDDETGGPAYMLAPERSHG